jgi:hypothetical protein
LEYAHRWRPKAKSLGTAFVAYPKIPQVAMEKACDALVHIPKFRIGAVKVLANASTPDFYGTSDIILGYALNAWLFKALRLSLGYDSSQNLWNGTKGISLPYAARQAHGQRQRSPKGGAQARGLISISKAEKSLTQTFPSRRKFGYALNARAFGACPNNKSISQN